MRFWAKLKIEDRIFKDVTVNADGFIEAVDNSCNYFDMSKPLILEKHLNEMASFRRTVFYADDFVENIPFETFEIENITNDKKTK